MFDNVDNGRIKTYRPYPLSLDTARSADDPLEVSLAGNVAFLDDDSTGKIYIRFNDKNDHAFPFRAGAALNGFLFKKVFLHWDAQPGRKVNIITGSGVGFGPTLALNGQDDYSLRSVRGNHYQKAVTLSTVLTNYTYAMLYNPAGSNVALAVKKAVARVNSNGSNVFFGVGDLIPGTSTNGVNKDFRKPGASVAEMVTGDALAVPFDEVLDNQYVSSFIKFIVDIDYGDSPVIIPPGKCYIMQSDVVTAGIFAFWRFDWEEIPA